MPDQRFFHNHEALSLADALEIAEATLSATAHSHDPVLARVAAIGDEGAAEALVFAEKPDAVSGLEGSTFGLCLATEKAAAAYDGEGLVGVCANPRLGFARIAAKLHSERRLGPEGGVHNTAAIGTGAAVHATATIGEGASIGDRSIIGPGAAIGPGVEIGPDSVIGANVSASCAVIGARANIKPGACLGQSGFGFVETAQGAMPMPQLGRLIIGADVEIGANTTVDRGALGDTKIGDGSKIDNLVQIGHNVVLGRGCIMAAQVGVSGSTVFGDVVIVGGKAGFADHLKIGDGVMIAAGSGVMHDVPAGEKWGGRPAQPMRQWFREVATLSRLAKKKK